MEFTFDMDPDDLDDATGSIRARYRKDDGSLPVVVEALLSRLKESLETALNTRDEDMAPEFPVPTELGQQVTES